MKHDRVQARSQSTKSYCLQIMSKTNRMRYFKRLFSQWRAVSGEEGSLQNLLAMTDPAMHEPEPAPPARPKALKPGKATAIKPAPAKSEAATSVSSAIAAIKPELSPQALQSILLLARSIEAEAPVATPTLTVGQAILQWLEARLVPAAEDPRLTQYEYVLQTVSALQTLNLYLQQWHGAVLEDALREAPPEYRAKALRQILPPALQLLGSARYQLKELLSVLYAAQSAEALGPDEGLDLYTALVDIEKLVAQTRPLENRLGVVLKVPNPVKEPQFPVLD